jgi:hypothetical protein
MSLLHIKQTVSMYVFICILGVVSQKLKTEDRRLR